MVSKIKIIQHILFLLLIVYFAQGFLYPAESIIAKFSLAVVLLISAYFMIKEIFLVQKKKPVILLVMFSLLFLNLLGFVFSFNYQDIYFNQFKNITTVLLPFFAFYSFSRTGNLNPNYLRYLFFLFLITFVATLYHSRATLMLEYDRENVVSNAAYFFVMLIPFLFFIGKRNIYSFITLFALLFLTIQGAKRGAIITSIIGAFCYLLYHFIITSKTNRLKSYIALFTGVLLLSVSAIYVYQTNEFLVGRMIAITEGGSGRGLIYKNLLTAWYNSNDIITYLFGYGFVATIEHSGTGVLAHNDWLELLVNFGLTGVIIYLALFIFMLSFALNNKFPLQYRLAMASLTLMWFAQTLFSMYYTSSSSVISMVIFGYILGSTQYQKN